MRLSGEPQIPGIVMATLNTQSAFQLLTFIAAPALLTNASSVLVLSTSNRFARAVDRVRTVRKSGELSARQFTRVAKRALLLNRALTAFYIAVSMFAIGTLSELFGGGIAALSRTEIAPIVTELGLFIAVCGTAAIATGAALLIAESSSAAFGLREEARDLHGEFIAKRS